MPETLDPSILEDAEGSVVEATIELFSIDLTPFGGTVHLFAPEPVDGAAPAFGGQTYSVLPCQATGFEWSGTGPMPQPSLRFAISRVDGDLLSVATTLLALLEQYDDLLGATVTRVETLRKHLDDGLDPDGQKHLGIEIFTIEQKPLQNGEMVEFRLTSAVDMEDVIFPRRRALNRCPFIYRIPAQGGGFDYARATCPYTDSARFDYEGNAVATDAEDKCGKDLIGCKARFGDYGTLPFGGFPAIGKIRLT